MLGHCRVAYLSVLCPLKDGHVVQALSAHPSDRLSASLSQFVAGSLSHAFIEGFKNELADTFTNLRGSVTYKTRGPKVKVKVSISNFSRFVFP